MIGSLEVTHELKYLLFPVLFKLAQLTQFDLDLSYGNLEYLRQDHLAAATA